MDVEGGGGVGVEVATASASRWRAGGDGWLCSSTGVWWAAPVRVAVEVLLAVGGGAGRARWSGRRDGELGLPAARGGRRARAVA